MTEDHLTTPVPATARKRRAHPTEPPPQEQAGRARPWPTHGMCVYDDIATVQTYLAETGITKDRSNVQQNYKFRGVDDVMNAICGPCAATGLCILPRYTERTIVERTTAKGTALFYVTVRGEFDFVSATDGSKHTVVTYGEAMDSGDKATNKAMSAAFKYAILQAFSIPTEGDHDTETVSHEVVAESAPQRQPAPITAPSKPAPRTGALPKTKDEIGTGESVTYPNVRLYKVSKEQTKSGKTKWEVKLDGGPWATCWDSQLADLLTAAYDNHDVATVTIMKNDKGFVNVTEVVYLNADPTPDEDPAPMPSDDDLPF